jgi:hypothetical protein
MSLNECIPESSSSAGLKCSQADFNHSYKLETTPSGSSSVSWSSLSSSGDQFEDAPEDMQYVDSFSVRPSALANPLEALANACVSMSQTPPVMNSTTALTLDAKKITSNDVLCGRGGLTNHHAGNIFFRRLVRLHQEAYVQATKRDKASVAKRIVDHIRNLNPSGRFLKRDSNGIWVDIGDRKAREKTSQALREGAPEIREELTFDKELNDTVGAQSTDSHNSLAENQNRIKLGDFMFPSMTISADQIESSAFLGNRLRIVSSDSQTGIQEGSSKHLEHPYFYNQHHIILDDSMRRQLHNLQIGPDNNQPSLSPESNSLRIFPLNSKRKFLQALDEGKSEFHDHDEHYAMKGPRLKLLKKRIQCDSDHVTSSSTINSQNFAR